MTIKNLWGEIQNLPKVKSPVAILNEQAQLLENLTSGLLVGRISLPEVRQLHRFAFIFSISAPSLNNYSYAVLRIEHDIGLYPVSVSKLDSAVPAKCRDADEFEAILQEIFTSPEVQRVISGLLAQIQTTQPVSADT